MILHYFILYCYSSIQKLIFSKFLYCVDNCNADAHANFLVVFHLYNELRHTHKQEMELKTCVCTSSYFCHFFTNSCWGRTYFFLSEIMLIYSFFIILNLILLYICLKFFYIFLYYFFILCCFIFFLFYFILFFFNFIFRYFNVNVNTHANILFFNLIFHYFILYFYIFSQKVIFFYFCNVLTTAMLTLMLIFWFNIDLIFYFIFITTFSISMLQCWYSCRYFDLI